MLHRGRLPRDLTHWQSQYARRLERVLERTVAVEATLELLDEGGIGRRSDVEPRHFHGDSCFYVRNATTIDTNGMNP